MKPKRYIGDGVYVEYDGQRLILTTENGIEVTNTIYIERETWDSLYDYVMDKGE